MLIVSWRRFIKCCLFCPTFTGIIIFASMSDLSMQNITYLPGVGPKRAELLKQELKIASYEDLLFYFPYKYVDRSKFYQIREVNAKLPYIQVKGRFTSLNTVGSGRQSRMTATFSDGTGVLELVWFKGHKYVKEGINSEAEYIVFGKPSAFNGKINIVHPELEKVNETQVKISSALQAFYNTTEKMKKRLFELQNDSKASTECVFVISGEDIGKPAGQYY